MLRFFLKNALTLLHFREMIRRKLYQELIKWRASSGRKPLIIRGARQVGKTTLVREFAREFSQVIFLNLEKQEDKRFFDPAEDLGVILKRILFVRQIPENAKDTLIFIDEIQESPHAIKLLRYFYEEYPQFYVIAAGSLLEFALGSVKSFPVGRVEYLTLHPISFEEFVWAKHEGAYQKLQEVPLDPIAYHLLLELYHEYALIGGMPEIVARYLETNDLVSLGKVFASIQKSYEEDIPKYAAGFSEEKILKFLIQVSPLQADKRITYQNFGNSGYRSREVSEGLRLLEQAGFVYLLHPTTDTEIPALPDLKKSPRLQYLDTGLMASKAGIQSTMIGVSDLSPVFRGRLIQHLTTQEVISSSVIPGEKPLFWVREKKSSQAEVDLVIQAGELLIPVEVKSGPTGKLRSLHQFMDACPHRYAVRLFANQLSIDEVKTTSGKKFFLMNLPYFLAGKLTEYIHWFISSYSEKI